MAAEVGAAVAAVVAIAEKPAVVAVPEKKVLGSGWDTL